MNEAPRLRVEGLATLVPALAALEAENVSIPLATRLAVDRLVRIQPSWSAFELVEALTALIARSPPEADVVRRTLQRSVQDLEPVAPAAPALGPLARVDADWRDDVALSLVGREPVRLEPVPDVPSWWAWALKKTAMILSRTAAIPVLSVLAITAIIASDRPPSDVVPYPPGLCPPPDVKAACPTRRLTPQGTYVRWVGTPPERDDAERPAAAVAIIALMGLLALTVRARWASFRSRQAPGEDESPAFALQPPPWPALWTADERARLSWAHQRSLTDEDDASLDVPATVRATVERNGFFSPRHQTVRRERAIWLLDDVNDPAMLRGPMVDQLQAQLSAVGVPYRRWVVHEDGLLDVVAGRSLSWGEFEDLGYSASVVMISSSIDPGIESQLPLLAALPHFVWVDPAGDDDTQAILSAQSIAVIAPAALPRWIYSGRVAAVPAPSPTTVDLWAGLILRYQTLPAATPTVAAALAEAVGLPGVRALDLPLLWRRSSEATFALSPSEAERVRTYARTQFPDLWSAAEAWQRERVVSARRTRSKTNHAPTAQVVASTMALMTVEDALAPRATVDDEVLAAALTRLYGQSNIRAHVRRQLQAVDVWDVRERWPAKAQRLWAQIEGGLPGRSGPSWPMRWAWALMGGAAIVASARYAQLASRPSAPSTQIPITFVNIPGGRGCMGSAACQRPSEALPKTLLPDVDMSALAKYQADSEGLRVVRLSSFALAQTETTQSAFRAWISAQPSANVQTALPGRTRADHPAVRVTWAEARRFCRSLGPGFDLPTEAQWEYAARAGTMTRYFFGDDVERLGDHAWYKQNANGALRSAASPRDAHPLGLQGLLGNAYEWVRDGYRPRPEADLRRVHVNPCVGCSDSSWRPGGLRVMRGGAFHNSAAFLGSARRLKARPDRRLRYDGFRCSGPFIPSSFE